MSSQRILKASMVDLTFGIWAIAVPTAFSGRLVNGDGDMPRHVAMGDHMLRVGWIRQDLFSFTKSGEPFLAYEWGSQITYALFHRIGGIAGVAIGAGLVIAAAYALIVLFLRRRGVDPLLGYLVGLTAAALGTIHWLARPHLFTLVGIALLLFLIEPARPRDGPGARFHWQRTWLFAPLFIVWANVHPGFIIGFAILALYLAGDLVEAWIGTDRQQWLDRAKYHASGIGIGLAASLVNPHTIRLHAHILSLLGNSYLIDRTGEFRSPDFHLVHGTLFLLVIGATLTALALSGRRLPFPRLLLLLFMLASALFARRNIPLFGLVVLPVLALELDGAWRRLSLRGFNHVRRVFQENEALAAPGRWFGAFVAIMILLALGGGRIGGFQVVPNEFDEDIFPIHAVSWARQAGIDGRIYHAFTWGGYFLYAWPGQKIFIDGMTDFFGEELTRDYVTIARVQPGWDRKLDEHDITIAMIPANGPLAYALERDGWHELYSDGTAVILRRAARDAE